MSVADLLRKHTNGLANVISYPNIIASALYSKEIISRSQFYVFCNNNNICYNVANMECNTPKRALILVTRQIQSPRANDRLMQRYCNHRYDATYQLLMHSHCCAVGRHINKIIIT